MRLRGTYQIIEILNILYIYKTSFPNGSAGKESAFNAGDTGDESSISGSGRSPGGEGDPLQYSCLENPMNREAWRATLQRAAESDTTERLSTHIYETHTVSTNKRLFPEIIAPYLLNVILKSPFTHIISETYINSQISRADITFSIIEAKDSFIKSLYTGYWEDESTVLFFTRPLFFQLFLIAEEY